MKKILHLLALALVIAACNSGKDKYPEMAQTMCDCFNKVRDSMPASAMKLFEKAAVAPSAKEAYESGAKELAPEDLQKMMNALLQVSKPGSAVSDCLMEMDKKYKTAGTQKEATAKMVDALKGSAGCEMMITMMRMQQEKGK
jgi:hypothetical protein